MINYAQIIAYMTTHDKCFIHLLCSVKNKDFKILCLLVTTGKINDFDEASRRRQVRRILDYLNERAVDDTMS